MTRTIFMGTPDFAETILTELSYTNDIEIVAVYTEPDKPKGRGHKVVPSPVKAWAEDHDWTVEQPPGFRKDPSNLEKLKSYRPDLIVVAAYGKILPKELIEVPTYGCVNVHASLLPAYRGASPIQYALLNNEVETGITLMLIDEGLDTGPILSQEPLAINQEDDFTTLSSRLALLGAKMIKRDLPRYLEGKMKPTPQPTTGVSVTKLIEKTDGEINWTIDSLNTIVGKVRAFTPWPGAYTFLTDGKRLVITKAHLDQPTEKSASPGKTLEVRSEKTSKVEEGRLVIDLVKPEGRPEMPFTSFLQGYRARLPDGIQNRLGL